MSDLAPSAPASWPDSGLPLDFDMDLFLVEAGLRALGKWEGVEAEKAEALRASVERIGLRGRAIPGPSGRDAIVFFAADDAILDEASALENEQRRAKSFAACAPSSRRIGALLGYPACCVEAFVTGPQEDEPALLRLGATLDRAASPLLNFFPRSFSPTGFVPCGLDCEAAIARGREVVGALERRRGLDGARLEDTLSGVVLWLAGPFFVLCRGVGERSARGFSYASVVSTVEHPAFPDVPAIRPIVERSRALARRLRQGSSLVLTPEGAEIRDANGATRDRLDPSLSTHFMVFGR